MGSDDHWMKRERAMHTKRNFLKVFACFALFTGCVIDHNYPAEGGVPADGVVQPADGVVVGDMAKKPDDLTQVSTCGNGSVACGRLCTKCVVGVSCVGADDCLSGICTNNMCADAAATCSDGQKNGTETDVDCGGSCTGCAVARACAKGSDCLSGICQNLVCIASAVTCSDGQKNGTETDVDCGGSCTGCAVDKVCAKGSDCASGICTNNQCKAAVTANCSDSQKNGAETDVDCGGGSCTACAVGKACLKGSDCVGSTCTNNVCASTSSTATCSDGKQNGTETDIDCGGSCAACAVGKDCLRGSDCISGTCTNQICVGTSVTCSDGIKNGAETDVDCGGASCSRCTESKICYQASDCASTNCWQGYCRTTSCTDGIIDGYETDQDCGGGICATCAYNKHCVSGSRDCQSGVCNSSGYCTLAPSCYDNSQNGQETDVDCGGSLCSKCVAGKHCVQSSDCQSGACSNSLCGSGGSGGKANGASCGSSSECASGLCSNYVCTALGGGGKANGAGCGGSSECTSGCCASSICGDISTCNSSGLQLGQTCSYSEQCSSKACLDTCVSASQAATWRVVYDSPGAITASSITLQQWEDWTSTVTQSGCVSSAASHFECNINTVADKPAAFQAAVVVGGVTHWALGGMNGQVVYYGTLKVYRGGVLQTADPMTNGNQGFNLHVRQTACSAKTARVSGICQ